VTGSTVLEESTGDAKARECIHERLAADLTILRNDPSRDIRALAAVGYTIRDGKVIYPSPP
jgi:hypothetical protein